MSVDYASGLSHCDDLGVCGLEEVFDKPEEVSEKVMQLADLLRDFRGSCVVHVGAGLSTSAGIRDFRGKGGVWTELTRSATESDRSSTKIDSSSETKVKEEPKPTETTTTATAVKPFEETVPTFSHNALKALCQAGFIKHLISQNVDGLFLKANFDRKFVSELHGNFYLDECTMCRSRFIRSRPSQTMRLQISTVKCPGRDGRDCRGHLRDTILDWDSKIPYGELRVATRESKLCKLHICIGTSLQLSPSKDLVYSRNRNKAYRLVIINLQPTKFDSKADLVINYYADEVMKQLASLLGIEVGNYLPDKDPTKNNDLIGKLWARSKTK